MKQHGVKTNMKYDRGETPNLRWFDELGKCSCGKPAVGILRGVNNESYGAHCKKCAERRLRSSGIVRGLQTKLTNRIVKQQSDAGY